MGSNEGAVRHARPGRQGRDASVCDSGWAHDRICIVKAAMWWGYAEFDQGAAQKFVIDRRGMPHAP